MRKGFGHCAWMTALVAVLAMSACTRPENNIGLDVLPEEDLLSAFFTDTVSIVAEVVADSVVTTDEINPVLCARWSDPALGTVNSGFYMQLRLEAANPVFGNPGEVFVDSLILSLAFDELYPAPDRAWQPSFNVHRLAEFLELDSTYTSVDAVAIDPTSLEADPAAVYDIISIPDSVDGELLDPQVRIYLDPSLGEVFLNAPTESLASSDDFVDYFEGLYVELEEGIENQQYQFDLEDGSSRLTMYYRTGLDDEQDTTTFDFTINNNSARYTRIQREYQGYAAPFAADADSIDFTDGQGYIQGGAGFGIRVKFPFISEFNNLDGRNINRAELIIPATSDPITDLDTHSGFIVREKDSEGEFQLIGDHNTLVNVDGGYEQSSNDYRFIITRHIQDLINGETESDALYILSTNRQNQLLRNILNGQNFLIDGDDRRMRLLVAFSD